MSDSAFQVQYRQEAIAQFEQTQSLLRDTTTIEAELKGNQAVFLTYGTGGNEAVTRGINGLIPSVPDDLNQFTATLAEWHDLRKKTGFNIFASQGNLNQIMQRNTMAVLNKKIDQDIITELNTATNDTGVAQTGSLKLFNYALAILGNNEVAFDGNIWAVISPGMLAYLNSVREFASADYVTQNKLDNNTAAWADRPGYWRWLGVNIIVHPKLPGRGTNAEKCFMYHKSAIGHAVDVSGMKTSVGYDEEQDYTFARATCFMGSKLLQNSGIVVMNHDGSAWAAQ